MAHQDIVDLNQFVGFPPPRTALLKSLHFAESDVILGVMRVRGFHEAGYGATGTGRRHNRSWPEALKREIVAASLAPVSAVARHYDVNANQVFIWRKRYREELGAALPAPQLIPVPF